GLPSTPVNSFLTVPTPNGPLDNASAKKRWLRQAISEETDPAAAPSPNSRPNSPTTGVECLAPLKKRRLARASMSSEVSNTPPSTPNNVDTAYSEMDAEGEIEPETHNDDVAETEETESNVRDAPSRKWSCSEVSSAEEDMEDLDDTKIDETSNAETEPKVVEDPMTPESSRKTDPENNDTSDSLNRSPRCSAGRRSRWDQVDAPEPVVSNSISSPVKSTDAIVLDYVRNPEQYAKLTGVAASFDSEKGASNYDKDLVQLRPSTTETSQPDVTTALLLDTPKTSRSTMLSPKVSPVNENDGNLYSSDIESIQSTHREHAESSPRIQTQVKKKLSMEEYLKRKMEGKSDDRGTALNQPSTALNAMTNSDSNSSEAFVISVKEMLSPKPDDDPNIRGTLQFSSTPTLAERKREELGKRLIKSFGIRVPDAEPGSIESIPAEKQPAQSVALTTPTYTASPRDVVSMEKQKPNGSSKLIISLLGEFKKNISS
ncbi:hypothetical protein Ocin01_10814, partial [Orchesella cincta]